VSEPVHAVWGYPWQSEPVCRSWIYAPAETIISRLVCTKNRGHDGAHEAGRRWSASPNVWIWTDDNPEPQKMPRRSGQT
jgi:hypothetical protein